jgi:hypothetical protein
MLIKYTFRNSPRAPAVSIKIFVVLFASIALILMTVLVTVYVSFGRQHIHFPVHKSILNRFRS